MSPETRTQQPTNELTLFNTIEPTVTENEVATNSSTYPPSLVVTTSNTNTNTITSDHNQDTISALAAAHHDTTDKCKCGADKPQTDETAVVCTSCKKAICMVKGCKKRYSRTGNARRHQQHHTPAEIANLTDYSTDNSTNSRQDHPTDKCMCGEDKPQIDTRTAICTGCKKAVCMFRGCQARYSIASDACQHQKRHTPAEIEEFRKYRETHCTCGAARIKVHGKDWGRCTNCNRIWCTRGQCFKNFSTKETYDSHNLLCPFLKTEFDDKCSKCGYSPKIRNQEVGTCPNCGRFWCLILSCHFESDVKRSVRTHQGAAHWTF